MTTPTIDHNQLRNKGYTFARGLLGSELLTALARIVESSAASADGRGGVRNLLDIPAFRDLAESPIVRSVVTPALGDEAFVVRGILFDKTDAANWKVPWHQDVTIAVTQRIEADNYGPWSVKAGVIHVQPPASILERMLSVRIHIDDCPSENGALRVLPQTHQSGKLDQPCTEKFVAEKISVTCEAKAGDALLMRPLLLHASSASAAPKHRRVIHFDYANEELPNGMEWRERVLAAKGA
jgi:ectoine hydroxylase-related dioxygenase (phytanoyl-CoA dioxygenase family)